MTVWFLVIILMMGNEASLDRIPEQFATQNECFAVGRSLFITKYDTIRNVYCIEADDDNDLIVILRDAFKFKGDEI